MASASTVFRKLAGVFAVYKPPYLSKKSLSDQMTAQLINGLNGLEQRPIKCMVEFKKLKDIEKNDLSYAVDRILNNFHDTELENQSQLVPTNAVDLFDHPLVQGPRFSENDLSWSYGHVLDYEASGVQIVGLQAKGARLLSMISNQSMPRTYRVRGRLGLETTTYSSEGKVLSRATWNHIKSTNLIKVISLIQGSHRNSMLEAANIDLSGQRAYELACKGLLRPKQFLGPMFLDIKLTEFNPPEFALDIVCLHESCEALRALIHHIGERLYSKAVCTSVHRSSDGIFLSSHPQTLISFKLGNLNRVIQSINYYDQILIQDEKSRFRRRRPSSLLQLPQNLSNETDLQLLEERTSGHS